MRWVPWDRFTVASGETDLLLPVAARTATGRLVVACQQGDRVAVTTGDSDGQAWSSPRTIARAAGGADFVTTGLGRLSSGRLVLLGVELRVAEGAFAPAGERPAGVPRFSASGFRMEAIARLFTSDDEGQTWTESAIDAGDGFKALIPCGHPVECDGKVVLLCHGPVDEKEMDGRLSSLGLLASDDNGASWRFARAIVRADVAATLGYGPADLVNVGDMTLVAFVQVDEVSMGPGVMTRIARMTSTDGGVTWSTPANALVGPRPSAVKLVNGSILCATSNDCGVLAAMSHDGGCTWSSDQLIHQAIAYKPGKRGGAWLAEADDDAVFGVCHWMHSQREGLAEVQGFFIRRMGAKWPAGWPDRAGTFRREAPVARWRRAEARIVHPGAAVANAGLSYPSIHRLPDGKWIAVGLRVLSEDREVRAAHSAKLGSILAYKDAYEDLQFVLLEADEVVGPWRFVSAPPIERRLPHVWVAASVLKSGRIMVGYTESDEGDLEQELLHIPGGPRGMPWKRIVKSGHNRYAAGVAISDDGGRTWTSRYGIEQGIRISGVAPATFRFGWSQHPLELDDGTLALPCQCFLTEEHGQRELCSAGVVRSRDGGLTWGDADLVAPAEPDDGISYSEASLAVLADGRWVCALRAQSSKWSRDKIDDFMGLCLAYSENHGRAWSRPRPFAMGGETEAALLPDGVLYVAGRMNNQSLYWLSEDGGDTFFLKETVYDGPDLAIGRRDMIGTPRPIVLDENTILIVTDAPGPQVMTSGPIYARHLRRDAAEQ